jgi:hypothetical protein
LVGEDKQEPTGCDEKNGTKTVCYRNNEKPRLVKQRKWAANEPDERSRKETKNSASSPSEMGDSDNSTEETAQKPADSSGQQ